MKNEIKYQRIKIAACDKLPSDLFNDFTFEIGCIDDDFILGRLTAQLSAYVYESISEERVLYYNCDRPTFLDWILRRRKIAKFNLKVSDLLLNAPKPENTIRTYKTKQIP